ncbi:pyruvate:ferredoxin (flavodoxin) oxidoreductase [Sediminispirochaeta smaragdinae]|jgi:pyruvate-ferredoxin/flavodoxin oxidoreductase|uniref:Pyruvate ferredoxin/flavodoxin oxidoreductase n=1 Tax=Sediminispirochaeta smaragdinae (strain DSM 11293 / JCM 15392 / SEBR 4228) TaxID=573413 RepID=E1RBN3_SEDSS|nr:pyruvate:ferredoxin (flavodoxin) oxidoreductase [Sediminispirochaeta smaragdinae]ADK79763.1 pyruvate ferredoxin/flavodoxin oxidoreductase [Sediminispirochaeta smaragdinae DSM 11293]
MSEKKMVTIDGNTAVAHVAHATNEVIAIYPITPSSPMGELADVYSAQGRKNIWGTVPDVVELQSEAGASGSVHGALTTGALTTTFTASQGLLLMIPNMFKIAGELTSAVFHIAARAVAAQALSIFGDHSDVMAARSTGFAMLASNNVQETMDNALIAQAATLEARIPFIHFFDGFRTSHEIQKVEEISYDVMREMINDEYVRAHRSRGMNPEKPVVRGTSQNPDVFFAARETVNKFYEATPDIVQKAMDTFAKLTGRQYHLFDYVGASDAERVVVMMGSGADTMEETMKVLQDKGEKIGLVKVHLFRPFSAKHFVEALPKTVKKIAVLDRTKEPGSLGEPLYEDVRTAIGEIMEDGKSQFASWPKTVGGRYGLGSNEFTPGMAKAVFDNLAADQPKNHFTVGIYDDLAYTSLDWDENFSTSNGKVHRAMFYGLGSDGTVGANKNSIKIIGEATDNYAQGYFVYDSKKAGATTVSHLRFGKELIKSTYNIQRANFLACHKFTFLERFDILKNAEEGGVFLLASPYNKDEVWENLPVEVQQQIIDKKLRFYVIDAVSIAEKAGMGSRINVIMQTAFFKISGILPEDQAIELIKKYIAKTYMKKGQDVVDKNIKTIDMARDAIEEVNYPKEIKGDKHMIKLIPDDAPEFVKTVTGELMASRGEKLKTSQLPNDGTYPTGTTKYEKRNIAEKIPVWDPEVCIQCADCSAVCPHGVIRMKVYDADLLDKAPKTFKSTDAKGKEFAGQKFTIQVAPEDCTGCGACWNICPVNKKFDKKALSMEHQLPLREQEKENWEYFLSIPNYDRSKLNLNSTKGSQLLQPLFEFSGACAGCGETPYVKLVSQFFGDRAVIANATGCSSIYGGNLPTTPYTTRDDGRGPTWSNSLFEDAAEFGYGMRLTSDRMGNYAMELVDRLLANTPSGIDKSLLENIKSNPQQSDEEIDRQREWKDKLVAQCKASDNYDATELASVADYLIKRSVWVFGGDGWAYDIGYGGLDHVLASGRNINVLCMDTEVYSNTGGQMSKSTPVGAIAKFAASGKSTSKKDLGMMAMSYGYVYVARVAMGYNRIQTIKAIREAEAYDGPSLIIAYSHCINHGINMTKGMDQQKMAVNSGMWPLWRFNPDLTSEGKNPFHLDSKEPTIDPADYMYNEVRYKSLKAANPERAAALLEKVKYDVDRKYRELKYLADRDF